MNPLIQFKKTIPLFVVSLGLACFAVLPAAQAGLSPTPDGLYPGANVAEGGIGALFSLTTGSNNTAVGAQTLFSLTTGIQNTAVGAQALKNNTADGNTAVGFQALVSNADGSDNTATGWRALFKNTTGSHNTANSLEALRNNTSGSGNTAYGSGALFSNETGDTNTAIGASALFFSTGNSNIALGGAAGSNLTTGDSNIYIGNGGVAAESNTIRIGDTLQSATFIAGIAGVDVHSFEVVAIDPATGQLGELDLCDAVSNHCQQMTPTTSAKTSRHLDRQIARYEADNAKLRRKVDKLETAIAQQRKDAQLTAANQQKEIGALTAALKEQASQIQKVSAQLELSKPAPQAVVNNQ